MGHENESLDEFVEARNTCLNDVMYFPTRNAYGLSSVTGNMEKLAAIQSEFEIVKKKMDDDKEKALHLEKKVKVLTQGYEKRAENLRNQIQSTVRQIETAGTELECFQALHKQEQLAALDRINGLWEEVQKQNELEQTLQQLHGDCSAELERISGLIAEKREQAQKISAEMCALDLAESQAAANRAAEQLSETSESIPSAEIGSSMAVNPPPDEMAGQQINTAHMDVDSGKEHTAADMGVSLCNMVPSSEEGILSVDGVAGDATGSSETVKDDPAVELHNVVEANNPDGAFTKQENIVQETAKDGGIANRSANQVPGAEFDEPNLAAKDNLPLVNGDSSDL